MVREMGGRREGRVKRRRGEKTCRVREQYIRIHGKYRYMYTKCRATCEHLCAHTMYVHTCNMCFQTSKDSESAVSLALQADYGYKNCITLGKAHII